MRRLFLFLMSFVTVLPFLGQTIQFESASINDGDELSSISEITLNFNFDDVAASLSVEADELGISSVMADKFKYRMLLYKGSKDDTDIIGQNQDPASNENILGYGYKTIGKSAVVSGQHSVSIPFSSPISLEAGEAYTIYFPAKMFQAGIPGTLYSTTKYAEAIIIEIKGASSGASVLLFESASPESSSELDVLNEVVVNFNQNIKIAEDSQAIVTLNGVEYGNSSSMTCVDQSLTITFDNLSLYNGKEYVVTIPGNVVMSEDESQVLDAISLIYKGTAYQYMTTGRISPSTNNPVSWFTTVNIPFSFPDGYNIGNTDDVTVKLYEGDMDGEPTIVACNSDINLTSLVANVWKFDLKPSTSYYLVLDKETIFPARSDDYRIKLKDTTNDEVILVYTTPAELETPTKVTLSESTPTNLSGLEKLESVVVELAKYEFESTSYDVKLVAENPVAIFYDGTTETNVPLTYDIESAKATIAINRPLEAGKEYTLTIPTNTFAPSANENLAAVAGNDEIVLTYNGVAAQTYKVTCEFAGMGSMVTVVEAGKTATFDFTSAEGWGVASVTFNGEVVELTDNTFTTPAIEADALVVANYTKPVVTYHNLEVAIDEYASASYNLAEGETVTVTVAPTDGWKLESLTLNGTDVTEYVVDNTTYEIPAITEDSKLVATHSYADEIQFYDLTSDVANIAIDGSDYTIGNEGQNVVISNVEPGDHISVYTVNGMLVASHEANNNVVKISLPAGIYIIRVNNVTFKIQH